MKAHKVFDLLWSRHPALMDRHGAYYWMQVAMEMSSEEAHIGRFSKEQCLKLIGAVRKHLESLGYELYGLDEDTPAGEENGI